MKTKVMRKKILLLTFALSVLTIGRSIANDDMRNVLYDVRKSQNGVSLTYEDRNLIISFINPGVVRLQYVPNGDIIGNETNICVPQEQGTVKLKTKISDENVSISSEKLNVRINRQSGAVSYYSANGELLLAENKDLPRIMESVVISKVVYNDDESHIEKTANGDMKVSAIASKKEIGTAWKARQQFIWQDGEALYGLGSHQEDYMNLRGTMQYLYQHNLKATVPVLMSTKGYGLLFDAGSVMQFHDDSEGSYMEMEAVNSIDYYFMYGPEFDNIVAEFRGLTGRVPMMPEYMLGYIQSKERYANPHDIDSVLTRFRESSIPIDVIVQDWNYWNPAWWGHKQFYAKTYPNPDKMIQGVHDKNAHYMLSIWPTANGDEAEVMDPLGFSLGRGIYDAYQAASRKVYWDEFVDKNLFSLGVDAWWCDGTEPIDGDWNQQSNSIAGDQYARYKKNTKELIDLLGALRANTFSLYHSQGLYENQRAETSEKRVVNLTRSSYAGQQRYSTIVWNGDTKATWDDFAKWIPAGLNFMVTGCPYWTIDAGAFFTSSRGQWFWKGAFQKGTADMGYREFYVRNLQFSQWLPIFRSHGCDTPREPWQFGNPGEPFYESVLSQIKLRYRLLPYNYSLMAMVTMDDYTMTRPLVFDFRNDSKVYDIKDQFMFGPAFMACPVTKPMYYEPNSVKLEGVEKKRQVYLPGDRDWYDFNSNMRYTPGQTIKADAPIDYIPVFVRAGSIVPTGPEKQYSWEPSEEPLVINVYAGADGRFTLYEDEGDNYNYENSAYSLIPLTWNEKKHELTIGKRSGSFKGMPNSRQFIIKYIDGNSNNEDAIAKVDYSGKVVIVKIR
jgi:alpha-D-xyloside xylohydrolase